MAGILDMRNSGGCASLVSLCLVIWLRYIFVISGFWVANFMYALYMI